MFLRRAGIDLTKGSVAKNLILFFLPILLGSMFQQLYATADAVIVGRFAGREGLAAIDAVYNLMKLPINFFVGLSAGATIIISQHFGAKDGRALSDSAHTAVAFALAGGMLLSFAGVLIAPAALSWINVPDGIRAQSLAYVRIMFSGLAFSMTYNICAGILRAVGDSKTPFYCLIAASALNIALDLLFVGLLGWGVAGAALTTVVAQAFSALALLGALTRSKSGARLAIRSIRFHAPVIKRIFRLGLPLAAQSALYPVANILIQSGINAMGTDDIAAWALCGKLDFLIWLVGDGIGAALATFSAQNFGAGKPERIRRGLLASLSISTMIIAALSAILYLFYRPLGALFLRAEDLDVVARAGAFVRFLAPWYFLYAFGEIFTGAIVGSGDTLKPMLLSLAGTWAVRVAWMLLVVPRSRTMLTILACYPVSWALTALLFGAYYALRGRRTLGSAAPGALLKG